MDKFLADIETMWVCAAWAVEIILIVLAVYVIGWLFLYLVESAITTGAIYLKFNEFMDYYLLNPQAFKLNSWIARRYDPNTNRTIYIRFNIIDTIRYRRFRSGNDKKHRTLETMKQYQDLLDMVQRDVNRLREKNSIPTEDSDSTIPTTNTDMEE